MTSDLEKGVVAAFFAFLFTERLFTTIWEHGTGHVEREVGYI